MRVQPLKDEGAGTSPADPADAEPPTRRSRQPTRPVRSPASDTFSALAAPITTRVHRPAPAHALPPARRTPVPFPHRLAAPALGALLSGVLTYCLHQCSPATPAPGRLVRARTTYADATPSERPTAEPVFIAAQPTARRALASAAEPSPMAAESHAAPRQGEVARASAPPVLRPIDLRWASAARSSAGGHGRKVTGKRRCAPGKRCGAAR